jgi:hypothetical protein
MMEMLTSISHAVWERYNVKHDQSVNRAIHAALQLWSSVTILEGFPKTRESGLQMARWKLSHDRQLVEYLQVDGVLDGLWEEVFTRLTPYMREFAQDDKYIFDAVQWADTVGGDLLLDITLIRIY